MGRLTRGGTSRRGSSGVHLHQRIGAARGALDRAVDAWLGYAFPPAERVIAESGWRPDERGAWCLRCGDTVGPGEVTQSGCASCRDRSIAFDSCVRLGCHADDLRDWVHDLKFHRRSDMADVLGRRLGARLAMFDLIDPERTFITPIPMPRIRQWTRGADHAHLLALAAARVARVPVVRALRSGHAPLQTALSASERLKLGGKSLAPRRRLGGWPLEGLRCVLIDDVRTTGATINAAAKIMKSLGCAEVIAAVVAVSDEAARRARRESEKAAFVDSLNAYA